MDDYISRQAALDIFDDYNVAVENGQIEAYSRDRKRLCDLPPAQLGVNLAEVGTRAVRGYPIDADAFMEKVAEEYGERVRNMLYQIIRYMPPAQPIEDIHREKEQAYYCGYEDRAKAARKEQRTGKWIDDGSELGCQCSECGKSLDEYIHATEYMALMEIPNFCPNCGAKMEGVSNGKKKEKTV